MSAETLNRIYAESAKRLTSAGCDDEARTIGLDHMRKVGADLAENLFAHVAGEGHNASIINGVILRSLDFLQRSVIESFEAMGVNDAPYLDSCLEAATSGFLDRGEVLFEAIETRARA